MLASNQCIKMIMLLPPDMCVCVCVKCVYKKYMIFHLPSKVYQISILSEEHNNVLSAVTDDMQNNAKKQIKAEGHKSTISVILREPHQWQTHTLRKVMYKT